MNVSRCCFFVIILLAVCTGNAHAQSTEGDDRDSLRIYKEIEKFSKRNKVTKFLYKLVLKPVTPEPPKKSKRLKPRNFNNYNGRVIRSIIYDINDPFGYSIKDTSKLPHSFVQKAGNRIHFRTRKLTVRNFLLFKKDDAFDAFKISESERLLRQSGLFQDVVIYPYNKSTSNKDSVDILVRAIDRWAISGQAVVTTSHARVRVNDNNFAGLGHSFNNQVEFDKTPKINGWSNEYQVNRIGNTYMSVNLLNQRLSDGTTNKAISVNRPFYSPLTKYAGGILVNEYTYGESLYNGDTIIGSPRIRSHGFDGYVSRSIRLDQFGASFDKDARFLNLLLSIRSINTQRVPESLYDDTSHIYGRTNFEMGMVALSVQTFEQEQFVFRFGETEDIPTGKFIGLIGGFDPVALRQYVGIRAGVASFSKEYFYSLLIDAGKFRENNLAGPAAFTAEFTAFSPLWQAGRWRFRQFIAPRLSLGWRQPTNRFLTLNSEKGFNAISSTALPGHNRITISAQTQSYAPWNLLGFRLGPVLYLNGGLISDDQSHLLTGRLYSSIGFGLLIRNDLLILNTFQISLSFYPVLTGESKSLVFNDLRTFDFEIPSLQRDSPGFVNYP